MCAYKGIDVSEWQGDIDFTKVKNSGIDFVMARASYGMTAEDECWRQNVYNAHHAGLHVGAYHFVYATDVSSAKTNADKFLRTLSNFKGKVDYPVACDFEYDSIKYMRSAGIEPSVKRVEEIVRTFCDRVEKAGYYTMLYTNQDFLNNYFYNIDEYDIWYALWTDTPVDTHNMVQYADDGRISGVRGNVDLDVSYIDYATLIKKCGLNYLSQAVESNTIHVGDKVKVINPINYDNSHNFTCWYDVYDVIQIDGNRVVIGIGKTVTSAIDIHNIKKV